MNTEQIPTPRTDAALPLRESLQVGYEEARELCCTLERQLHVARGAIENAKSFSIPGTTRHTILSEALAQIDEIGGSK